MSSGIPDESAAWLRRSVEPFEADCFPEFLRRRNNDPDRVALLFQEKAYSYRDLHEAIAGTAQALAHEHGVVSGDRVMMNMENSDVFMVVYLAVHRAGAVAVPINPKLVAPEIAVLLADCRPVLYVCDADKLDGAAGLGGDGPFRAVDGRDVLRTKAAGLPLPLPASAAPATIFYTSGTTGVPKGVVHTHRSLVSGAFQTSRAWGYDDPNSTVLAITPLFHVAAHSWFYPLLAFDSTIILDSFRTERAFELIEKHRVDGFNAVPAMLLMMVESEHRACYNTGSVTRVRFGASPMPPARLNQVQALFPNAGFYHGMGQTESGGTISVLPPGLAFEKNGSTGFPIPGCDVRIVDEEGNDVAAGQYGEVLARGPHVMQCYYNRPEATAATLAGGWLHTGDVGFLDEERCVYLVDRKKDMIIRGGENIYSVEIENVLLRHPDISACAVVGVADEILGEAICAVVVPRSDAPAHILDELAVFCRAELAPFKVPQLWHRMDELPMTATGKIQKGVIRERVGSVGGPVPRPRLPS